MPIDINMPTCRINLGVGSVVAASIRPVVAILHPAAFENLGTLMDACSINAASNRRQLCSLNSFGSGVIFYSWLTVLFTDRSLFWEINDPEGRSTAAVGHGGRIVPSCWRTKQNIPGFLGGAKMDATRRLLNLSESLCRAKGFLLKGRSRNV